MYSFTYGGLKVSGKGEVLRPDSTPITGTYVGGEIVGGVFFSGYPGGAGLTAGAVLEERLDMGQLEHLKAKGLCHPYTAPTRSVVSIAFFSLSKDVIYIVKKSDGLC